MKIPGFFLSCILLVHTANFSLSSAAELIYSPNNPSFGGNALNAQWLMNEAQVQNEFEIENDFQFPQSDPLDDFKESLNRTILSKFADKIVSAAFGETVAEKEKLKAGIFNLGDYTIEIKPFSAIIKIIITDNIKGNKTQIEVPYYN